MGSNLEEAEKISAAAVDVVAADAALPAEVQNIAEEKPQHRIAEAVVAIDTEDNLALDIVEQIREEVDKLTAEAEDYSVETAANKVEESE
jgi:hypothetical protein